MIKFTLVVALAAMLTACGGTGAVPDPLVDKPGMTVGEMNRDLADCRKKPPLVGAGNYVTKCMAGKGYTILEAR